MGIRKKCVVWAAGFLLPFLLPLLSVADDLARNTASPWVPFTLVHLNDLHSHYRPDKGPKGLGGVARIATTFKRIREGYPNTMIVDGGDWSEGSIYYNLDAGRTALEMLNKMGVDAAVLGNHDWLNGPDQLTKILKATPPKFQLLGSNLDFTEYEGRNPSGARELKRFFGFKPGTASLPEALGARIIEVGSTDPKYKDIPKLKIGVIGVTTYALIFDHYLEPVQSINPYPIVRKLAAELRKQADLVVVISHNGLDGPFPVGNRWIASLPDVDIVIHSHDHAKLSQPIRVERRRDNKVAYIVEAGCWGQFVGRMDLVVNPTEKKFELRGYELIQQDATIPEDPEINAIVDRYEEEIEATSGKPVFHDDAGHSNIHVRRESHESAFGNLMVDSYQSMSDLLHGNQKPDVAFEHIALTSGEIHPGPLHSVDIYNALTPIFNVRTNKAWTLKTMKMTGDTLDWLLNLILTYGPALPKGLPSVAGLQAFYEPLSLPIPNEAPHARNSPTTSSKPVTEKPNASPRRALKRFFVGGKEVQPQKQYLVAMGEGIMETINFLEVRLNAKIPRTEQFDTGLEQWRILADYIKRISPITSDKIPRGGRLVPTRSDLGLYSDEILVQRSGCKISLNIPIRNLGSLPSGKRILRARWDRTPLFFSDDPNFNDSEIFSFVPPMEGLTSKSIAMDVNVSAPWCEVPIPVYLDLLASTEDHDAMNESTWIIVPAEFSGPLEAGSAKR